MQLKYSKITAAMLIAMGLTACGGESSSSSSNANNTATSDNNTQTFANVQGYSLAAQVQNASADYVSDALVCVDVNDNDQCDETDAGGVYTDVGGSATIKNLDSSSITSGHNLIAVLPNGNIYKTRLDTDTVSLDSNALAGQFALNPLSTAAATYASEKGLSASDAKKELAESLGTSEESFDDTLVKDSATQVFVQSLDEKKILLTADVIVDNNGVIKKIETALKEVSADAVVDSYISNGNFDSLDKITKFANNLPEVSFSTKTSDCKTITFTPNATDADNDTLIYRWNFGDGSEISKQQNPTHTYTQNKTFDVFLSVSDGFGETNYSKKVKITNSLCGTDVKSLFTFHNRQTDPSVVEFVDNSTGDITEYFWDFGDEQHSSLASPIHRYEKPGNYTVMLTVHASDGRIVTSDPISVTVSNVANSAPVPQFDIVVDNLKATITNSSYDKDGDSLTYKWTFSDGTESEEKDVTHYFAEGGAKSVNLMVSDGKTTVSLAKTFTVTSPDALQANIVSANSSDKTLSLKASGVNASENAVYTWTMGDGSTETGAEVTHTYARDGVYEVVLTITDGDATATATKTIKISNDSNNHVPVSAFESSQKGLEVSFKSTSSDEDGDSLTYAWNFGDGSSSTEKDPTHSYAKTGSYTVKLTVSDGKASTSSNKKVDIVAADNNLPEVDFDFTSKDLVLSYKANASDADGDALTYDWDFGDGSVSDSESGSHAYKEKGTYEVTLTVSDGKATAKKSKSVSVQENTHNVDGNHTPVADFHYAFTGLDGKLTAVATDEDNDELTYTWDLGDGLTSTEQNPTVKYTQGGQKAITLVVSDGKVSSEAKSYTVTLEAGSAVTPTKQGIYYKGDADGIYIWAGSNTELAGKWPGSKMSKAQESTAWSFYDTSAISYDTVNMIFLKNNNKLTGDITNAPVTGCYDNGKWTSLAECTLSGTSPAKVEGGASLSGGNGGGNVPDVVINDIPWNQMDYATDIASSDVRVDSAPYVSTDLAPGSYHEDKTVTLKLQDADFNNTKGTIYYTLDNTEPTEDSTKYTGPITLKDTSSDGLGTAYRLRTLSVGTNGMKQEQHFFWFIKKNKTVPEATDFRDETIYFVLTARYKDGDESNNYYDRDRYDAKDPSWRGDFKGLIDELDYIKSMGFTAIWITPPVENRSGLDYHGYHAYDWFQPDLRLESKGATYFDFIKAAHAKGIKVIQDVVINHSSNYGIRGQAWIEKIPTKYYIDPKYGKNGIDMGVYQGNIGDYKSFNRCDNDNPVAPAWHRSLCAGDPNATATFTVHFHDGDVSVTGDVNKDKNIDARYYWNPAVRNYLPEKWYHVGYTNNWESVDEVQQRSMAGDCVDLKTEDATVQNYMNSMMKMYLDMGVDAIRLDTMKHMPREDIIAMANVWRSYKKNLFVFGEALIKGYGDNTPNQLHPWYYTRTSSASETPSGESSLSALDFPLMSQFRNSVRGGSLGGLAEPVSQFDSKYADATKLVTFFQNHDLSNDNTWSGAGARMCCDDPSQMALGMNVLWFFRGIPVLYAGDENNLRAGMTPDLAGNNDLVGETGRLYIGDKIGLGVDPYGIVAHMADLNAIRKASIAMRRGAMKILNGGDPMVFERTYQSENAIVAMTGGNGASVTVSGATDGNYTDLVTGKKFTVSGGSVSLGNIPANSARVLVKNFSGTVPTMKGKFLK